MRLIFLIVATLALGACGKNNQAGQTLNADQGLTAENIVANDVTAIDAVTGDAANMAADVNYLEFENETQAETSLPPGSRLPVSKPPASKPPASKPPARRTAPAESATSNTPANVAANTQANATQ